MQIYKVGGAVRDELLGKVPKDVDYVVVGSTPEEMLAKGFIQVGADFPVFLDSTGTEYALARRERKMGEGYLGFVTETENVTLEEDLSRRDLTINAMARPVDGGSIIDPFGGQRDMDAKLLRHVSAAFTEDPLRVIRLARFYARFTDYAVASATMFMSCALVEKGELNHLPPERFWAELAKVFTEERPDRFFAMIHAVAADIHTTFFSELYGDMHQTLPLVKGTAVMLTRVPEDMRLMIHVALLSNRKATLKTAPARTQALAKNIDVVRSFGAREVNVDKIFTLMKQAKAWSEGPAYDDLVTAMEIGNLTGERYSIRSYELLAARRVSAQITSTNFPDLKGKELGAQIDLARKKAIARVFNLEYGPEGAVVGV